MKIITLSLIFAAVLFLSGCETTSLEIPDVEYAIVKAWDTMV